MVAAREDNALAAWKRAAGYADGIDALAGTAPTREHVGTWRFFVQADPQKQDVAHREVVDTEVGQ